MEAKLSTWLVRIVINQALKKLRKQKREGGTVALDKCGRA
jgi:DNA-directed RNA polymerase specialized sigma24 family protein